MKKLLLFISATLFSFSLISQVTVISQTNATCPAMCNGAVTLSITGGTMPYTVSSIGAASSCFIPPYPPVSSSTITIAGLCPCTYSLQVKDATAATVGTVVVTITAPPPIVNTFSVQNVCCNGQCNGAIYSFVTGGTPGYSYTWTPIGPSGPNFTAACAGVYTLSVKDSKGCPKTFTSQVTQPPVFSVSASTVAASCGTCCNGVINAVATGGQPGYSYTVNPGNLTNTTGTFSNMCSGTYTICASDAGCCTSCIVKTVPAGAVTTVQNITSQSINISVVPNPSDGNFNLISQQNISQFNYEIFDVIGNKIVSGKVSDNINMNQSADGVYILIIRNTEGEILARRKINIKH